MTITPEPAAPRPLMKPADALFDRVTICTPGIAARSTLMTSTTVVPEAIHTTACEPDFSTCCTMSL